MAAILPPPPVQDNPGSFTWMEWYRQLRNYITQNGSVPWSIIDFAGSDLSDIASRSHEVLQGIQGGTTGQHFHLTLADYGKVLRTNTIEFLVPLTGFSYTVANASGVLVMKPAGVLASGTITMPAIPIDEQKVTLTTTQTITALTHNPNAGQTLNGPATTLSANTPFSWIYRSADNSWYRI